MQKYEKGFLVAVIAAALLAAAFIHPRLLGNKWRPWRLGLDLLGGSHLVYRVDLSKVAPADQESVVNGLRDVIEKRVNLFGVSEPQVFVARSAGETRLVVELAGVRDVHKAIQEIGETPFLEFREVQEQQGEGTSTEPAFIPTKLTGRYITGAQLSFDTTGAPQVSLTLNSEGAKIFEELTARNIGRPIAVFLDGNLITMPVVRQKISGGKARITGSFTVDEAKQLAERFNAGALPAPITLINQQTVSAQLGIGSLRYSIVAGAIGTIAVIAFMLFYYGMLGIFAAIALLIYILLTLALFKIIPVTMTLAGLAGFILTIGMAVDANILIFERTYEELARGLAWRAAVEEGFRRAWPSIRDSNISTMITALILYLFTSSFIRGFALTLFLGTILSMFSAITVTRSMLHVFLLKRHRRAQPAAS